MEFMDSFKRLDNLCLQVYGNDAGSGKYVSGVAMYMNEMRKYRADAEYLVDGWDVYYERLKHYLSLRNSICHDDGVKEEVLFSCGELSENDVRWLEGFCNAMLEGRDPIALYYTAIRARREAARKANRSAKSAAPAAKTEAEPYRRETVSSPQPGEQPDNTMRMYNESPARKRGVKIVIAVAAALLGVLAVAAGVLLAYGML